MSRRPLLALLACGLVVVAGACGSGGTKTITVTTAGGGASTAGSTSGSTTSATPTLAAIKVEQTKLVYLPEASGGHFHNLLVLLRNTSGQVAENVGATANIYAGSTLLTTDELTPVTLLPGAEGLLVDTVLNLSQPDPNGRVSLHLTMDRFIPPNHSGSPVSFSQIHYQICHQSFCLSPCSLSALVTNTFTRPHDNLQLEDALFRHGVLVGGSFTYVDHVFPKTPAIAKFTNMSDPNECPSGVDKVEILPNLGDDKIFSP